MPVPRKKPETTTAAKPAARKRAPAKATPEKVHTSAREAAAALARSINSRKGFAGTVVVASEQVPAPARASTGSSAFDTALGKGLPRNQWTEVIGNESSGKTTFILKTLAAQQAADPDFACYWVASEPFDESLAQMCGVDLTGVWLLETNIMEEAYNHIVEVIANRAASMIVLDSYPALSSIQEDEKDMELVTMGGAKVTNQFFRKVGKAGKRSLTDPTDNQFIGVFVNQWREKIGVMHGDPRTTSGGKGKNFSAYCRIDIKRDEWIVNSAGEKVGIAMKIVVMKMKGSRPQQVGVTDFYFADHKDFKAGDYDTFKALIALAELYDIIGQSGSFFTDLNGKKYQGRAKLIEALRNDPEQSDHIREKILDIASHGKAPVELVSEEEIEEPTPISRGRKRDRGPVPA